MEQQNKSYLQRIANILLINGGFTGNPGLYTGEMGLSCFSCGMPALHKISCIKNTAPD